MAIPVTKFGLWNNGLKPEGAVILAPVNRLPTLQMSTIRIAAYNSQAKGQLAVAYSQSPADIAQRERVNPQKGQGRPVSAKNGHLNTVNHSRGTKKVSIKQIPALKAKISRTPNFSNRVQDGLSFVRIFAIILRQLKNGIGSSDKMAQGTGPKAQGLKFRKEVGAATGPTSDGSHGLQRAQSSRGLPYFPMSTVSLTPYALGRHVILSKFESSLN